MTINSVVCPDLGRWRAWLDNADGTARFDDHLASCPACQRAVADLRQDAATAGAAIASLPVHAVSKAEHDLARERLTWRLREPTAIRRSAPLRRSTTGLRVAAGSVAAAVLVSVIVAFTPEGRTAAAAFLAQFRSRQVVAIEVSPQSQEAIMRTFSSLNDLGAVQSPRGGMQAAPGQVTVADAGRLIGFPVQTPDPAVLPAGLDRTPRVQVIPAGQMRFTFDKAKAQRYLQSRGQPQVNLPDKFNGASLVVSTPAAAMLEYSSRDSHQSLIIGQAGEIVVDVQGQVTLDEMRDFLLGLPGLPKSATDQLRQIKSWTQTLPVPVPIDKVNWTSVNFQGRHQGLLLNDNSGLGSVAIWNDGGHMLAVAGSLKANDLKVVADSLAVR